MMPAPKVWDGICADWDDELITTEDIKILAALRFRLPVGRNHRRN